MGKVFVFQNESTEQRRVGHATLAGFATWDAPVEPRRHLPRRHPLPISFAPKFAPSVLLGLVCNTPVDHERLDRREWPRWRRPPVHRATCRPVGARTEFVLGGAFFGFGRVRAQKTSFYRYSDCFEHAPCDPRHAEPILGFKFSSEVARVS